MHPEELVVFVPKFPVSCTVLNIRKPDHGNCFLSNCLHTQMFGCDLRLNYKDTSMYFFINMEEQV
jgi:hypothetical protein